MARWAPSIGSAAPEADGSRETRLDLTAALRILPHKQRTAMVLFYLGDLPVPQIAHLMQISEGTVKAHLAQGRRALRGSMEAIDD
ncbi:MAG: sigma factor-like helix-turn-helix DNA-binding protein [Actinomycetota bacterium]